MLYFYDSINLSFSNLYVMFLHIHIIPPFSRTINHFLSIFHTLFIAIYHYLSIHYPFSIHFIIQHESDQSQPIFFFTLGVNNIFFTPMPSFLKKHWAQGIFIYSNTQNMLKITFSLLFFHKKWAYRKSKFLYAQGWA